MSSGLGHKRFKHRLSLHSQLVLHFGSSAFRAATSKSVANDVFGGGWYMQASSYDLKRTVVCHFFIRDEIVFSELFLFCYGEQLWTNLENMVTFLPGADREQRKTKGQITVKA